MPLTMRQIPVKKEAGKCSQLTTPTISITSEIFGFLGYEGVPRTQQQNFEKLLDRAEITYKQITYNDPDADVAVKADGLQLTEYHR